MITADNLFLQAFKTASEEQYFAPGRANLIGEYTDVGGGNVLPFAIQLGIFASLKDREDRMVNVFSLGEKASFSLDDLVKSPVRWLNYIIGVFYIFKTHGIELEKGFDVALNSDLPTASGLSSSAALEVLFGTIIQSKAEKGKVSDWDIVKFAKETENKFIGLNSGIMDQFACKFGKKDNCMLLDTRTLEFSYSPLDLKNNDLIIMNSNKQRGLTESKYNDRVKEIASGLSDLKPYMEIKDACLLNYEEFEKNASHIKDPNAYKRLKHLILENQRVLKSAALLKEGKIDEFCKVLNEGHQSMRYDFESSGKELDTLVDLALKNGAKGARMTGAGYAGCAIFISDKRDTKRIINEVIKGYKRECGRKCDCYYAEASDGARRIK
ncbi:MAG: galactokinase [Bacilli bacterium]|jgi:galactokinase|nr:galactokinase [Bacilli bacterium]